MSSPDLGTRIGGRHSLMRVLLLVLLTTSASACATHSILRDPMTGQTVNCSVMSRYQSPNPTFTRGAAMGTGAAEGMISAFQEHSCIASYRSAGFVCISGCVEPVSTRAVASPLEQPSRAFTPDALGSDGVRLSPDTETHSRILGRCTLKTPGLNSRVLHDAPSKWPEPFKACYRDELNQEPR